MVLIFHSRGYEFGNLRFRWKLELKRSSSVVVLTKDSDFFVEERVKLNFDKGERERDEVKMREDGRLSEKMKTKWLALL